MLTSDGYKAVSFCAATPTLCLELQAAPGMSPKPASNGRRSRKRKRAVVDAKNAVDVEEAADYQPGGEARSDGDAEMEPL